MNQRKLLCTAYKPALNAKIDPGIEVDALVWATKLKISAGRPYNK